jgi:hypothetical protein
MANSTQMPQPSRAAGPCQNGVTRPKPGTVTGRVWEIADEVSKAAGVAAVRKGVIAKGRAEGINEATLSTQYGHWRRFHGFSKAAETTTNAPGGEAIERRILKKLSNQVVGNAGLYYVCYRLSLAGWNAMPTSRNARGIDILAYNQAGDRFLTIQVKALSKRNPVPLGLTLPVFSAQHIVICQRVLSEPPRCFVLSGEDVRQRAHRGLKEGKESYWLQPKAYEEFLDRWDRIGSGLEG